MIDEDEKRASELPSSDVSRRLEEANWDQIHSKLVLYAQFKLETISWPSGHPPGGIEAGDLAQEAIESLFFGRRTWNVAKHPDLEVVLKGIIKSRLSHLVKTKDNRTRRALFRGCRCRWLGARRFEQQSFARRKPCLQGADSAD